MRRSKNSGFLDRLIERLDKLDPESIQTHILRLVKQRGLLESVFQSIQEGVLVIDRKGLLRYANRAAENLFGFSAEQALNRSVRRYLRDLNWDGIIGMDEKEWTSLLNREIEIGYPEPRVVRFYVAPLNTEGTAEGEQGILVILRDVTHEREIEQSSIDSARISAIMLLAAGVAHEIGNPLNAMGIHLQLLSRELKHLTQQAESGDTVSGDALRGVSELAATVGDEIGRLDSIVTQFLQAVRPAKPVFRLERLNELLTETLKAMKYEIENRAIRVEIDAPHETPPVMADSGQIKQAFYNIVKNAMQAMPDGGSLQIGIFATETHLGVAFRDSGCGIAPEDMSRLFEPYYSTKKSGSGLGLMIVERIAREHGGWIDVLSHPGEGATFTLLLPLAGRRIRLLNARSGKAPALIGAAPIGRNAEDAATEIGRDT